MQPLRADVDNDPRLYTVSVSFERYEDEARDEAAERGFEIEHQEFDCEQLQRLAQDYGFSEASDSHLATTGAGRVWFRSTSPREDRAHFERGEQRYFALHIKQVDGREPTAADMQRVGDYLGIAFANRVDEDDAPMPAKP